MLNKESYNNILREVKEAQILRKNKQPLTSKRYRRIKRYDIMNFGDMQKLIESCSGENDDSNIPCYCKTDEMFDILETAHVNIRHNRTKGKRHCFVCDSQNILFISSFIHFESSVQS